MATLTALSNFSIHESKSSSPDWKSLHGIELAPLSRLGSAATAMMGAGGGGYAEPALGGGGGINKAGSYSVFLLGAARRMGWLSGR